MMLVQIFTSPCIDSQCWVEYAHGGRISELDISSIIQLPLLSSEWGIKYLVEQNTSWIETFVDEVSVVEL